MFEGSILLNESHFLFYFSRLGGEDNICFATERLLSQWSGIYFEMALVLFIYFFSCHDMMTHRTQSCSACRFVEMVKVSQGRSRVGETSFKMSKCVPLSASIKARHVCAPGRRPVTAAAGGAGLTTPGRVPTFVSPPRL